MQLKVDNKLLSEENARLGAELAEVQHARGSITTVPVPGKPFEHAQADCLLDVLRLQPADGASQ